MRRAWAAVLVSGCYAPSAPSGVPCDPAADHCPSGQRCHDIGGNYLCTSTAPIASDADIVIDVDAPADAAVPDAVPPDAAPVQQVYPATVAECIDPTNPDTALCRAENGNDQMVVDGNDAAINGAWYGFVRFDIDTALAGKTITSVTLRLTATDAVDADGPDSGSVWRVSPFTLASLSTTTPAPLDTDPIAGTRGAVTQLDVIEWPLPTSLVTPGSPVYLSVVPNVTSGVNYWNIDGTNPPRLVVHAQ